MNYFVDSLNIQQLTLYGFRHLFKKRLRIPKGQSVAIYYFKITGRPLISLCWLHLESIHCNWYYNMNCCNNMRSADITKVLKSITAYQLQPDAASAWILMGIVFVRLVVFSVVLTDLCISFCPFVSYCLLVFDLWFLNTRFWYLQTFLRWYLLKIRILKCQVWYWSFIN